MKVLKQLNLMQLSKDELKKREMNLLKGGEVDCCGCGSSSSNRSANSAGGYGYSSTGSASCDGWIWNGGSWDHSNVSHC